MGKRVLITGPESSGKTTLAAKLAQQEGGVWVREYARDYLTRMDRPYQRLDLDYILVGQMAAEQAMTERYPLVYCDTGPEVLYIWSKYKYGKVSDSIEHAMLGHTYDEIILCYPDLPWQPDPLRETPDIGQRRELFKAYEHLFLSLGRKVDRVHRHGSGA